MRCLLKKQSEVISVITVVKNDKEGLLRTIHSVRRQERIEIQHIIVDGSSVDGSSELALAESDVRVDSLDDGGIYFGMQRGLDVATGRFVIFLNSGDTFLGHSSLRHAVDSLVDSQCLWGFGPMWEQTERGTIVEVNVTGDFSVSNIAWRRTYVPFPTVLSSTALLKSLGGFDTRYRIASDFHSIVKLALNSSPARWALPLVLFQAGGVSYQQAPRAWYEEHQIRIQLLGLGKPMVLLSAGYVRLRILKWFIGKLLDLFQQKGFLGDVNWRDRRSKPMF